MSYPVPSCASFNGNADVAASLLSAGNANKAVNVAPRHEELVIQQGLSRRNASKDLDFRTSNFERTVQSFYLHGSAFLHRSQTGQPLHSVKAANKPSYKNK